MDSLAQGDAFEAATPARYPIDFHRLAHDLNNLLGIVLGNADLLLDVTDEAQARRRVERIREAAAKASELIAKAQSSGES